MINQTKMMELAGEWTAGKALKKASATPDAAAFAQMLFTPPANPTLPTPGFSLAAAKDNPSPVKTEPREGSHDNTKPISRAEGKPAGDSKTSIRDDSVEGKEGLSQTRDSGPGRQTDSNAGVDDCENGVQPGAGTEAIVNAPPTTDSSKDGSAETSDSASKNLPAELTALLRQMKVQSDGPMAKSETGAEPQLSAKAIESARPEFGPNLNLGGQQQILFETGLAEHFVRMVTDKFQSAGEAASKTETTDAARGILSVGTGSTATMPAGKSFLAGPAAPMVATGGSDTAEAMNRIVQIVRSNVGLRQSQMTVQLDPPELGKMRLEVKLSGNNLQLNVTTQTDEARQMLVTRMETLRANLEQSGIQMTRCEITARASDFSGGQDGSRSGYDSSGSNAGGTFSQSQNFNSSGQEQKPFVAFSLDPEPTENPQTLKIPTVTAPHRAVNLVA